jgi:hypothetical protein
MAGIYSISKIKATDAPTLTVRALGMLGAPCHARILREAGERYLAEERIHPKTAKVYVELVLEGDFDDFDSWFHKCESTLIDCLKRHLEENADLYLDIERKT